MILLDIFKDSKNEGFTITMKQQLQYKHPYNGPSADYGILWNRQRFAIFKSMNYRCSLCGEYSKGNLHLHHIVPIGCGGSNHPQNLVPLCSSCHNFVHSGKYHGPLLVLRKNR